MTRHTFAMPDVGEGLTEAEILTWHVSVGDQVQVNQIIVEIETAKAAVELPCPYAGTVAELLAEPGQTVAVGTPIIAISGGSGGSGPATAAGCDGRPAGAAAASGDRATVPTGDPGTKIGETTADGRIATLVGYVAAPGAVTRRRRRPPTGDRATPSGPTTARTSQRVAPTAVPDPTADRRPGPAVPLAKPPVRKLARELGIDLRAVTGSGPSGVITRDDLRAGTPPVLANGAAAHAADPVARVADGIRRVPVRGIRRATAAAMVASAFTAPHVTEFLTVDVTPLIELRDRLRATADYARVKLSPLVFAAKAVCLAARRTPEVNASWRGDGDQAEIVYFERVQLGIAAATPRGLIVPKIRDADQLSLRELALALAALTDTARAGGTPPKDLVGGTFTITNVGVFGVDTGTPILNPGESAILALGAVKQAPWVVDGALAVRTVCQLALSFDHRVVDGEQGSRFLADVGALLADPALALTY